MESTPEKARPRLSVILPLFDLRDCGLEAFKAALAQEAPRNLYEIVIILGREEPLPEAMSGLLEGADRVVRTGLDISDPRNEAAFYRSGVEASRGEFLFFLEGHTVPSSESVPKILDFLNRHPACDVLSGAREEVAKTSFGRLVAAYAIWRRTKFQEVGDFGFGGNNVIRRKFLEEMGGIQSACIRFSELILHHRILHSGHPILKLPHTLCRHHNDMSLRHLVNLTMAMGEGRSVAYSEADRGVEGIPPRRHGLYQSVRRGTLFGLPFPIFRFFSFLSFFCGAVFQKINPRWAFGFLFLGLGFADMAGFCRGRRRAYLASLPAPWLQGQKSRAVSPPPTASVDQALGMK